MAKTASSKITAFHEAGHALAHVVFHVPFNAVSILPCEDGSTGRIEREPDVIDPRFTDSKQIDERIIIALAGPAAEGSYAKLQWSFASEDFQFAVNVAAKLQHLSVEDVQHYLTYLWSRTLSLLKRPGHWNAVEQIADHLLQHGRISSEAVYEIYKRTVPPLDPDSVLWRLTPSPSETLQGGMLAYSVQKALRVKRDRRP